MVHRNGKRRGTVAVIVAVCSLVLLSMVALSLDGGVLQDKKRQAQATADAAAMAAATSLFQNYPKNQGTDPDGLASAAAFNFAKENGFSNDGTNSTVVVNIPPKSGPYTGLLGYCEVIVTWYQQRAFSRIFGADPIPVRARAVSRGAWVIPNAGVIVLAYSGKGTLSSQGNGAFTETGAPVIVNSNNQSAAIDTGNGILKAPEFDITGGYSSSGNGQLTTTPTPGNINLGVHPTPDPLAYLPVPDPPGAGTITKTSLGGGNFQYLLSPGTYYNLPNCSTGDVVIFQQASAGNGGIFYLAAGGFNSQGATILMDPNTSGGMMLYNAGTGTNDAIKITGNPLGTVNITPLTDGPYSGLSIFQARNAPETVNIAGNGNFNIQGTLYVSNALLSVTGNGALSNIGSQYVSLDLAIGGNGNVFISWAGKNVARTRIITLVE
ncbi:MAG TPA: pilus assembly protein TadG-related protein [Gemmataceae bacterium]|nr:pilus assembly protein TadG-related protein [Gemmataceae bacterium]